MKMKKILALVMSLTMTAAMGMTAFAENATIGTGSQSIDVEAKYSGGIETPTVYSVDVSWGAMEFTYAVGGTSDWNSETHEYVDNTTAQWTENGNTVSVTNHSNAGVTASFAFDALETYSGISGTFDNAAVELPSAEGKAVDAAELTGSAALTLDGVLDSSMTEFTKIGAITVTIN